MRRTTSGPKSARQRSFPGIIVVVIAMYLLLDTLLTHRQSAHKEALAAQADVAQPVRELQRIGRDRLDAILSALPRGRAASSARSSNDPTRIIISPVPARLVLIDGAARYREVTGTALSRVVNARTMILRDSAGTHYLRILDGWMTAPALGGPWSKALSVPEDCERAATDARIADLLMGGDQAEPPARPSLGKGPVPHIYIVASPAELIVTEGPPKYRSVPGTALLFAENASGGLFLDTRNRRVYVFATGRWFAGPPSLRGPWVFVARDRLPPDFKAITDSGSKE